LARARTVVQATTLERSQAQTPGQTAGWGGDGFGARALQGRGIGRGDKASFGQRRLGLGELRNAASNGAPQLVATSIELRIK
jgi:hypothetical protein